MTDGVDCVEPAKLAPRTALIAFGDLIFVPQILAFLYDISRRTRRVVRNDQVVGMLAEMQDRVLHALLTNLRLPLK